MNGFRVAGKRHIDLTNKLINRLNKITSKNINSRALCKFLNIPIIFYKDAKGNQRIQLRCTTKKISGHISKLEEFQRS